MQSRPSLVTVPRLLYVASLCARVWLLTSAGYMHPDELHQSVEISAPHVFGFDAEIPWESADCDRPFRSSAAS
jgi:phosphatidylinositol glycan class Z